MPIFALMNDAADIDTLLARTFPLWREGEPNALGFDRAPADTRVVVAMSGGVDSSVTAALLHEQGFDVIGITLQLYDHGVAVEKAGSCCAGRDIHDARNVASSLGIPHYVLDYESRFRQEVMEDFADSYMRGETPIPCVTCNQTVKFRDLMKAAKDLGADCLATGHYVGRTEIRDGEGRACLSRAVDTGRDQSYFLFATTAEQMDYLRFPLGGLKKAEVRALAARYDLAVADKPDSQDICFVPGGRYADVIERLRPGAAEAGEIVDLSGSVLGRHDGIIHYTIGQRRGLGIGGNEAPLFVVRLEPETRRVVVGPREALLTRAITVRDLNWLGGDIPPDGLAIGLKVRSTQEPVPARIFPISRSGNAEIRFDVPEAGVSPGQAAVCYGDDMVLGGGWISGTTSAHARMVAAE